MLRRNNIYYSAYGVCTETHRNNSTVYLYSFRKVHRYVVESERAANALLGYAVDKDFDMFPAEAVHCNGHIRPDTTAFSDFHAGCFRQCFAQCFCRVYKFLSINSCSIESGVACLLKQLPTTTTSASSVVGFNFAVSFVRSPAFICTVNSLDS